MMDDDENDLDGLFDEYGNEENDDNTNNAISNSAQPTENAEKVPAPKRVIKNPRLKFNADRLCGERGIPVVVKHFEGVKFKGKGHEVEDLNKLLSTLEHWCHRLYPSMKFEDCLRQIEKLGKKRPVQTCLRKIRLDMPILNDDFIHDEREDPGEQEDVEVPPQEAFDRLINEIQTSSSAQIASTPLPVKTGTTEQRLGSFGSTLTDEQRKRMEYNKMLAAERRKAKFLAEKNATVSQDGREESLPMETTSTSHSATSSTQNQGGASSMLEDDFTDNSTSLLSSKTDKLPTNDCSEELELDDLVDLVDEDEEPPVAINDSNISPEINLHVNKRRKFIDLCNEIESDKNYTEVVDLEKEAMQNKVIEVINLESKRNTGLVTVVDLESESSVNNTVQRVTLDNEKINDASSNKSATNSDVEVISTSALFSTEINPKDVEVSMFDTDKVSSQNVLEIRDDTDSMEVD